MSLAPRDAEALELVASRRFSTAYVASLAFDMQTRRMTLRAYGTLWNGNGLRGASVGRLDYDRQIATLTFFGVNGFALRCEDGSFPASVAIASLALAYPPEGDEGTADLRGVADWSATWRFDGLAYEEHAGVLASLVDDG